MKRILGFLIAMLFVSFSLHAQKANEDVIWLKNGEKYTGEIVLRNADIVMLKTADGKQFQFQVSEIEKITQQERKAEKVAEKPDEKHTAGSLALMLQGGGGVSALTGGFGASFTPDVSLAFGTRNAFGKHIFLGAGVGYETVLVSASKSSYAFLPVFVQLQSDFGNAVLKPALNVKTGYAFHLQDNYKGGLFLQISGGANYQITQKSSVYFGLFARLQRTNGSVTETLPQGDFTAKSNAVIRTFGLTTAFIF